MKDVIDAILRRPQAEYLDSLLPLRDPLLEEMEAYAEEHGHPIADPEVAQLMRVILKIRQPRHLIEVGTNIGYSVVVMGRECGAGSVVETIELSPKILGKAKEFVGRAGLSCEVVFHQGAALEVIPKLDGTFDFAFIDAVKTEYDAYLEGLIPRMAAGGVLMFDNLLWKGQVAEGAKSEGQRASTAALEELNRKISSDPRLLTTIVPVGDGVGISIVRG